MTHIVDVISDLLLSNQKDIAYAITVSGIDKYPHNKALKDIFFILKEYIYNPEKIDMRNSTVDLWKLIELKTNNDLNSTIYYPLNIDFLVPWDINGTMKNIYRRKIVLSESFKSSDMIAIVPMIKLLSGPTRIVKSTIYLHADDFSYEKITELIKDIAFVPRKLRIDSKYNCLNNKIIKQLSKDYTIECCLGHEILAKLYCKEIFPQSFQNTILWRFMEINFLINNNHDIEYIIMEKPPGEDAARLLEITNKKQNSNWCVYFFNLKPKDDWTEVYPVDCIESGFCLFLKKKFYSSMSYDLKRKYSLTINKLYTDLNEGDEIEDFICKVTIDYLDLNKNQIKATVQSTGMVNVTNSIMRMTGISKSDISELKCYSLSSKNLSINI